MHKESTTYGFMVNIPNFTTDLLSVFISINTSASTNSIQIKHPTLKTHLITEWLLLRPFFNNYQS